MFIIDENEKLIKVFRKHPFYMIIEFIILGIVAVIPILFMNFLFSTDSLDVVYLIMFLYFIFLVILWVVGFVSWTNYYLDMWVLTDKRVISVEQNGLFSREISSLRLDRIQDVKVEVSGLIDTLLHIGSVQIQTAGTEKEFVIYSAKSPNIIREEILRFHNNQIEEVRTTQTEN